LALGVCATLTGLVFPQFGWAVFGLPLGVGAVIFGVLGIRGAREKGGRHLALAGAILGLIGPIASLFVWVLIIEVFDLPCC
jgi:hypothetical protein